MTRFFILLTGLFVCFAITTSGQSDSTVMPADSITRIIDSSFQNISDTLTGIPADTVSVSRKPFFPGFARPFDFSAPIAEQVLQGHPYFGFATEPLHTISNLRQFKGKELLFYALLLLILFFALLHNAFPKYFNDLFRLFFRTTLKQKQIREQLMQTPLPSLLLNIFFVLSSSLYISFLLLHFNQVGEEDFWLYFAYSAAAVSAIYFGKFIGLKIIGWVLGKPEAANSYIFIVFIINKVIGVFLLPFLALLAFSQGLVYSTALLLSFAGLAVLLIYRFLLAYTALHNQVRFNPFHFILYVAAFEIAPLLLIYKLLLVVFQ